MSIEIRLLKESEYEAANDFYNNTAKIYRQTHSASRTYTKFCWEFINCPYDKAIYAGAWESDEGKNPVLVGIQCVILLKMIDETGKQILSAKGEATLIELKAIIKHKKTDILKELFNVLVQECRNRDIEFIWGFNTIPSTYKRLGCELPFKSYHAVHILNPGKAYKSITSLKTANTTAANIHLALRTGISYLFSLKTLFVSASKGMYSFNSEWNENYSLFQKASFPDKLLFLFQDKKYLNWKISENPYDISYKSFQLLDENKSIVAQVICSLRKEVAFIEQTLFDNSIPVKSRQHFLKRILNTLKKEHICLVRYTGFNSNRLNSAEMNLFKSLGFVFTGKGEWFTFKTLSADSAVRPENIYLTRMYKQGVN
ncbi:MAG: hypothetical protein ACHQRM_06905 [Bacteroidia bacterium]